IVGHLFARARGAEPGERSREALAARALRAFARPEILSRIADDALDGPPPAREPARKLLVALGGTGVHALAAARERAGSHGAAWPGRPRFVAAVREIGPAALPALLGFLQQADPRDAPFLEDLLRAVPDAPGAPGAEPIGALVSTKHLRHEAPSVRRAAAVALA